MFYARRNIVDVTFSEYFFFSINDQFDRAFQDKSDLCRMSMFWQNNIAPKLHKN